MSLEEEVRDIANEVVFERASEVRANDLLLKPYLKSQNDCIFTYAVPTNVLELPSEPADLKLTLEAVMYEGYRDGTPYSAPKFRLEQLSANDILPLDPVSSIGRNVLINAISGYIGSLRPKAAAESTLNRRDEDIPF